MRVAVTGASGLFGNMLAQVLGEHHEVFPLTRKDADLTDSRQVKEVFTKIEPQVIVHPAGIADIDICELNPALAKAVNVDGTRNILDAAREVGAKVAYISTDAVFDGKKVTPYSEKDLTNPISVYGRSKLEGEKLVEELPGFWIFRVSVLFGNGKSNFVEKVVRQAAAGERVIVASDQVGSAMSTTDAAGTILQVIESGSSGTYHLANQGTCSRFELALASAKLAQVDTNLIIGKPLAQMERPGPRLMYAIMEMRALDEAEIPLPRHWEEALAEYISRLDLGSFKTTSQNEPKTHGPGDQ